MGDYSPNLCRHYLLHYRDFEIVIAFEQGAKMTFAMTLDLMIVVTIFYS